MQTAAFRPRPGRFTEAPPAAGSAGAAPKPVAGLRGSLFGSSTRTGARTSRSKPDRGLVHTGVEVLSQHGETVLTMTIMNLLRRRP